MQREIDTAAGYPNPAFVLTNLSLALRRRIRRPLAFPIPMQPKRCDDSQRQRNLGSRRRCRGEPRIKRDGRRTARPCLDDTTEQASSLEQSKQPHVFPRYHFFLGLRSNTRRLDVRDISPRGVLALKRLDDAFSLRSAILCISVFRHGLPELGGRASRRLPARACLLRVSATRV